MADILTYIVPVITAVIGWGYERYKRVRAKDNTLMELDKRNEQLYLLLGRLRETSHNQQKEILELKLKLHHYENQADSS